MVPQIQLLSSSLLLSEYQSKKRILQRCSNIPLYIFKTFSDHSAGCGFVGIENYAV